MTRKSESQFGPLEIDVGEPMPTWRAVAIAVGPTVAALVIVLAYAVATTYFN